MTRFVNHTIWVADSVSSCSDEIVWLNVSLSLVSRISIDARRIVALILIDEVHVKDLANGSKKNGIKFARRY